MERAILKNMERAIFTTMQVLVCPKHICELYSTFTPIHEHHKQQWFGSWMGKKNPRILAGVVAKRT